MIKNITQAKKALKNAGYEVIKQKYYLNGHDAYKVVNDDSERVMTKSSVIEYAMHYGRE